VARGAVISENTGLRETVQKTVAVPKAPFEEWSRLTQDWSLILKELDRPARCALAEASPEPRAVGELTLAMPRNQAELADAFSTTQQLEAAIEKLYNKRIKIHIRYQEAGEPVPEFRMEEIENVFQNIDITEEPADDGWGREGDL